MSKHLQIINLYPLTSLPPSSDRNVTIMSQQVSAGENPRISLFQKASVGFYRDRKVSDEGR